MYNPEYARQYYLRNREKILANQKQRREEYPEIHKDIQNRWKANNAKHLQIYQRDYHKKNKVNINERTKNYYIKNPNKILDIRKKGYAKNKKSILERKKIYRIENKEKLNAIERYRYHNKPSTVIKKAEKAIKQAKELMALVDQFAKDK